MEETLHELVYIYIHIYIFEKERRGLWDPRQRSIHVSKNHSLNGSCASALSPPTGKA